MARREVNMVGVRELPHLVSDTDRHGNRRYYVRVKGKRKVRLREPFGTVVFLDAYTTAVAKLTGAPATGTFKALMLAYFASVTFRALDPATQQWRETALKRIAKTDGDKPARFITPQVVRVLRDELKAQPSVANKRLKALRALFKWACAEEPSLMASNPARDVPLIPYVTQGHHSWEIEEVEAFEAVHPVGSRARLALALLLYTACRREDVVRLGPRHLKAGRLKYTQAKNEHAAPVTVDIPVHPELAAIIAATPIGLRSFLVTGYGKPYTVAGFGNAMRDWCDAAGLPECSAHGLRKACAVRLAESGATPHEIMAITGHQTLEQVEVYTKAARNRKLADAGMGRLK